MAVELHGRLIGVVGAMVHAGWGWGRVVVAAAAAAGWGSDVGLGTASPVLVAGVVVVAWRCRHLVTIPGRPMSGHGRVSAARVVEPSGAVAEKPSKSSHKIFLASFSHPRKYNLKQTVPTTSCTQRQ